MSARHVAPIALVFCVGLVNAGDVEPRPIERAAVGEWVIERTISYVDSTIESKDKVIWVDSIEGRKVHLKQQEIRPDRRTAVSAPIDVVINLDEKRPAPENDNQSTYVTDDEVVVAGVTLKCKKHELIVLNSEFGKLTTTTWTSKDVPVFGLVKSIRRRDERELSRTVLLAWGSTGGAELSVGDTR